FGYPHANDATPVAAVESALEMIHTVTSMQLEFKTPSKLAARVGIHTGIVVLGDMGDATAPQRLAVGATPNLAARAQSEATDNSVVITDATLRLVEGYFECEPVGPKNLRGVSQPVSLYRVLVKNRFSTRLDVARWRGLSPFVGR